MIYPYKNQSCHMDIVLQNGNLNSLDRWIAGEKTFIGQANKNSATFVGKAYKSNSMIHT